MLIGQPAHTGQLSGMTTFVTYSWCEIGSYHVTNIREVVRINCTQFQISHTSRLVHWRVPNPVYLRDIPCCDNTPLLNTLARIYQHDPASCADHRLLIGERVERCAAHPFNGRMLLGDLFDSNVGTTLVNSHRIRYHQPCYLLHQTEMR